jgi:hypothetical protein
MPITDDLRAYLDQAREQGHKAYACAREDERVGKYVKNAEAVAGMLAETVNNRIVQPVLSMAGMGMPHPTGKPTADGGSDTESGTSH